MNSKSVGATPSGGGGGGAEDYILIRDEKSSGTGGGTFTGGTWQTRVLNTKVADTGSHASLASNQITLPAGTYKVKAHAPAYNVYDHKIRLRNITDGADIDYGTSERAYALSSMQQRSFLESRFTIAASKVIELQHMCAVTFNSFGLGWRNSFGVIEVYAVIEFWKEV